MGWWCWGAVGWWWVLGGGGVVVGVLPRPQVPEGAVQEMVTTLVHKVAGTVLQVPHDSTGEGFRVSSEGLIFRV